MSDLFDDSEDDLSETGVFVNSEEEINLDLCKKSTVDARRRLEKRLEEERLRKELDDDLADY